MGDLSPNFSRVEFACHCGCGFDAIDPKLIDRLETLREALGKPLHINSGCRCAAYNAKQKGSAKNSQHILGKAADVTCEDTAPSTVAAMAERLDIFGGIGRYGTFTHVDVGKKRRWRG